MSEAIVSSASTSTVKVEAPKASESKETTSKGKEEDVAVVEVDTGKVSQSSVNQSDGNTSSDEETSDVEDSAPQNIDMSAIVTQVDEHGNQMVGVVASGGGKSSQGRKKSRARRRRGAPPQWYRTLCCLKAPSPRRLSLDSLPESHGYYITDVPERRTGKKCLLLDLDETLVHSAMIQTPVYDALVTVKLGGNSFTMYVKKRPGVEEFLQEVGKHYEIIIYTASVAPYAEKVLDVLDEKSRKVIDHLLVRDHCTFYKGAYVKDLRRVKRDFTDMIIVDNSRYSFQFQPENGILVSSFFHNSEDRELKYLQEFLVKLASCEDVRDELPNYEMFLRDRISEDYNIPEPMQRPWDPIDRTVNIPPPPVQHMKSNRKRSTKSEGSLTQLWAEDEENVESEVNGTPFSSVSEASITSPPVKVEAMPLVHTTPTKEQKEQSVATPVTLEQLI